MKKRKPSLAKRKNKILKFKKTSNKSFWMKEMRNKKENRK